MYQSPRCLNITFQGPLQDVLISDRNTGGDYNLKATIFSRGWARLKGHTRESRRIGISWLACSNVLIWLLGNASAWTK